MCKKLKIIAVTLLSVLLINHSEAKKEFVGDWITDIASGYGEAYVTNNSNSLFGLFCVEKCLWYVDFQKTCDDGDKYSGLISSDAGAVSVTMTCVHLAKRQLLTLDNFDSIQTITMKSKSIGFAIAMPESKFHVSRFSLNGSVDAQSKVVDSLLKSKNNYKDSRM